MKHCLLISSIALISASCSQVQLKDKLQVTAVSTGIPLKKYSFNKNNNEVASSRVPASAQIETSNKKLYFQSLLSQYKTLKSYAGIKAPKLKFCPSFHEELLSSNEEGFSTPSKIDFNTRYTRITEQTDLSNFPEFYLPLTTKNQFPRVADLKLNGVNKKVEAITTAMSAHLENSYVELNELCETGSSNNYYIYENMINHFKSEKQKSGPATIKILNKTPLFSNMAIIQSFKRSEIKKKTRSIASSLDSDSEIISRMGIPWAKSYYKSYSY